MNNEITNIDFYLLIHEGVALEEPRRARAIKRLKSESRDDLLLIEIDPPFNGLPYGSNNDQLSLLIIAPRYLNVSYFPIEKWPIDVHVARPLVIDPASQDKFFEHQTELIAMGAIYESMKHALEDFEIVKRRTQPASAAPLDVTVTASAIIRLLRSDEGGRITAIQSGYIGSIRFGELYTMGAIDFIDRGTLQPGDECEVEIRFGNPEYVDAFLKSGQVFDLTEGTRKVGEGRIVEMKK